MINENGHFIEKTPAEIAKVGMVTDALWTDINNDNWEDLIIVGEFMNIQIFKNNNSGLDLECGVNYPNLQCFKLCLL